MPYIKRTDGFNAAAKGRTLRGCAYDRDSEAVLVAEVDVTLPGDELLDATAYRAWLQSIAAQNSALPLSPPPPLPLLHLVAAAKQDTDLTALLPDLPALRQALQAIAQRL